MGSDLLQSVDFAAIGAILRRYSKQLVLGSLLAGAALLATLEALPTRYTAEAVIAGGNSPGSLQDFDGIRIDSRAEGDLGTESEASVMRSDGFLARLIAAIGRPRLLRDRDHASWLGQLQGGVQRALSMLPPQRPTSGDPDEKRAFERLKGNLEVYGDDKAPILRIRYTDEDPAVTADVVNAAAKLLLDDRRTAAEQQLAKTIDALRGQIAEIRAEIDAATERAARLRSNLQYFSTPTGSILAQQITDATRALSDATIEVSVASARYSAALASAEHDRDDRALNDLLDSPVLQRLVMEETTLQHDDAELASTLGTRHPERAEIKSRLADVGAAIQKEISRLLAALHQKVTEAQTRQEALQARLEDLRSKTAEAGKVDLAVQMNERQLDGLLRSQDGLVRLLEQLQFGTAGGDRLHIASFGVPPLVPSQPHRLVVFLIGLVVIIGTAFTFAVAHAVGTRKCLTLHGVRSLGLAREMFTIPPIQRGRRRHLLENPSRRGRLDRSLMRRVRDITLWMAMEKGPQRLSVAVSSIEPGEGKTTLSMLLAYGFASMGRRAVVLDCDHCSNGASKRLAAISPTDEAPPAPALYAASQPHAPAIRRTRCDGLYYTTASKEMCLATFSGDTSGLRDCLESLHAEFDVVIVDMPPVAPVTEAINFTPLSTFHLLVTDWKSARFDRLAQVRALFDRYHSTVDIIVFNRFPEERRVRRALRRSGYDPEERVLRPA